MIGADCVVGHRAHLEGCVVEDGCLIGSGSLVLNRARVQAGAVVAAAALVREDMVVPAGALAVGVPATIREDAGLRQREWIAGAVKNYLRLADQHRAGTRRIHLRSRDSAPSDQRPVRCTGRPRSQSCSPSSTGPTAAARPAGPPRRRPRGRGGCAPG